MWLDRWPTAASPICLRVCHPISQAAGGNWVHCSHHRIPWIESFIIWITMNVNEPHACSTDNGEKIDHCPQTQAPPSTCICTFSANRQTTSSPYAQTPFPLGVLFATYGQVQSLLSISWGINPLYLIFLIAFFVYLLFLLAIIHCRKILFLMS